MSPTEVPPAAPVFEYEHPNWLPLEARLRVDDCGAWMWMSRVRHGDRVIEQYKHVATRRYLNLDQDGEAWKFEHAVETCDPWCTEAHEHVVDPPLKAERVPFAEALEWALS